MTMDGVHPTEIANLEDAKARLLRELEETEKTIIFYGMTDKLKIAASRINGYHLKNFGTILCGEEKIYSACCDDPAFSIKVAVKNDVVLNIELVILENSPLCEVQFDLMKLCDQRCPHRVLQVIQQYIAMKSFRKKILDGLNPKYFDIKNTYLNDFGKPYPNRPFTILVYQNDQVDSGPILKVLWFIAYNTVHQSLAHEFSIKEASTNISQIGKFVQSLEDNAGFFSLCEEESLMKIWTQLNNWY